MSARVAPSDSSPRNRPGLTGPSAPAAGAGGESRRAGVRERDWRWAASAPGARAWPREEVPASTAGALLRPAEHAWNGDRSTWHELVLAPAEACATPRPELLEALRERRAGDAPRTPVFMRLPAKRWAEWAAETGLELVRRERWLVRDFDDDSSDGSQAVRGADSESEVDVSSEPEQVPVRPLRDRGLELAEHSLLAASRAATCGGPRALRSAAFALWRVGRDPRCVYESLAVRHAGALLGYLFARLRGGRLEVLDWQVPDDEAGCGERLLAALETLARRRRARGVALSIPSWSPWSERLERLGFRASAGSWVQAAESSGCGLAPQTLRERWWVQPLDFTFF